MDAILRTTKDLGTDRDQLRKVGRAAEADYSVECIGAQHFKGEEHELNRMLRVGFLSLEWEKERGLSVNSDEIRGHGKEILMNQNIAINMLYLLYESKCCMTIF